MALHTARARQPDLASLGTISTTAGGNSDSYSLSADDEATARGVGLAMEQPPPFHSGADAEPERVAGAGGPRTLGFRDRRRPPQV